VYRKISRNDREDDHGEEGEEGEKGKEGEEIGRGEGRFEGEVRKEDRQESSEEGGQESDQEGRRQARAGKKSRQGPGQKSRREEGSRQKGGREEGPGEKARRRASERPCVQARRAQAGRSETRRSQACRPQHYRAQACRAATDGRGAQARCAAGAEADGARSTQAHDGCAEARHPARCACGHRADGPAAAVTRACPAPARRTFSWSRPCYGAAACARCTVAHGFACTPCASAAGACSVSGRDIDTRFRNRSRAVRLGRLISADLRKGPSPRNGAREQRRCVR
jgi:hypothetical protein